MPAWPRAHDRELIPLLLARPRRGPDPRLRPRPAQCREPKPRPAVLPRLRATKPWFVSNLCASDAASVASDLVFGTAAMGRVDFIVGIVGALLLAHAAFSTVQYRGALKIREEDFTYPPPHVLVEVLISLVLCLWAALKVPGSYLPILPDAKENRVTKLSANLDFMIFNHRGKIFLPELVEAKFS